MTTTATTTRDFFEQAFERIAAFAREQHARRRQRIALASLMEMDASRLDDLGIDAHDVAEAATSPAAGRELEVRRAHRASAWTPIRPVTA
jgi:uncharacterized protein YjiS (DUF1127 family)